jgi:hypothetical protein
MLEPQIVVNLLQQVRVAADFLGHTHIKSGEDSSVPANDFFAKTTTESSTGGDVAGCVHFSVVAIALASDRVTVMTIIPNATSSIKYSGRSL